MVHAVAYVVLGRHPITVGGVGGRPHGDWFDAVDLAVRTSDGREVALGIRTRDYVGVALERGDPPWPDGHRPLAITLDPTSVRHWDFGRVLWIGPAAHRCLVWSNAEALSPRAIVTMLGPDPSPTRPGRVLDGPDGLGLPDPATVGLVVPADARWVPVVDE